MAGKIPPGTHKTKSEENIREEKTGSNVVEQIIKTEEPLSEESDLETDSESVIELDTDAFQKMEDENMEITEDMMDWANNFLKSDCH